MDPQVIPIDDRGFLLGDGLFETVLFKAGQPVLWEAHVARLGRGCAALGLPLPDARKLEAEARRALAGRRLGSARAAVRLTWTAGSGGRGLARPQPPTPRLVVSAASGGRGLGRPEPPTPRLIVSAVAGGVQHQGLVGAGRLRLAPRQGAKVACTSC